MFPESLDFSQRQFNSPVDTVKRDLSLKVPDHYSLAKNNQIPDKLSFEISIDANNMLHLDLSPVTVKSVPLTRRHEN